MHNSSIGAIVVGVFSILFGMPAYAACPTWTALTNGNTADANQVMGNFNFILQCPNFTGTVGFGLSSPQTRLDLGFASTNKPLVRLDAGSTNGIDYTGYYHNDLLVGSFINSGTGYPIEYLSFGYTADPNRTLQIGSAGDANFNSSTQFVPAVTINSGGSVGIQTTTPSYTLHVNGTAYATGAAGALSDVRHKRNIAPIENGTLAKVMKLHPVTFEWKEPKDDGMKGQQIGFIAQEVEEVLPSVVLTQNNAEKTKGLKYNELVAVMAKAIQELKKENDREAAVVADLKQQVAVLQNGRHSVAASEPILRRVQIALGWH